MLTSTVDISIKVHKNEYLTKVSEVLKLLGVRKQCLLAESITVSIICNESCSGFVDDNGNLIFASRFNLVKFGRKTAFYAKVDGEIVRVTPTQNFVEVRVTCEALVTF